MCSDSQTYGKLLIGYTRHSVFPDDGGRNAVVHGVMRHPVEGNDKPVLAHVRVDRSRVLAEGEENTSNFVERKRATKGPLRRRAFNAPTKKPGFHRTPAVCDAHCAAFLGFPKCPETFLELLARGMGDVHAGKCRHDVFLDPLVGDE